MHSDQQNPEASQRDITSLRTTSSRLYLIGMTGVGKSTLAHIAARRLGWIGLDTDACVERNSCMPIEQLFSLYGEEEFRRREWNCVRQTTKFRSVVVACGGGAPCFYQAIDLMLSSGMVIYLKAKIDTLIERLGEHVQSRPLLSGMDISLSERLEHMLEGREQVYLQAHHVIETDGQSAEDVVSKILALV